MKIKVQVEGQEIVGWGTSLEAQNCFEIELDDTHEFFSLPFGYFRYVDGKIVKKTDSEIQAIRNKPKSPTEEQRIEALEQALLALMMEG